MGDLLKSLLANRWGLTAVLAAAAALVGGGVVAHDGAEAQGAGLAAVGLVILGGGALVKRFAGAGKDGTQPPAGGAA